MEKEQKTCCKKCHGELTPKYGDRAYRCLNGNCPCHAKEPDKKLSEEWENRIRQIFRNVKDKDKERKIINLFKSELETARKEERNRILEFIKKEYGQYQDEFYFGDLITKIKNL